MKRLIFWLISLIIIGLVALVVLPTFRADHRYSGPGNMGISEVQMLRIARGMERYKTDFGNFPTGSTSEIFRVLNGSNPKRMVYVEYIGRSSKTPRWSDSFTDPWGSIYKIEIQGQTNVVICSAGINKIFGDDDDMTFDGATETLVKP